MPTYTVKQPLSHDRQLYQPGEAIDLPEDLAQPLLAKGVVEVAGERTIAPQEVESEKPAVVTPESELESDRPTAKKKRA